jgi:muconolactone delta-isomerase
LYQISTDRRIAAIAELEDAFQEESSSDDHVMNEMIRMAVSQAMELGMSNHAIPGSAPDKDSGDLFFQTLIDCLPREMPPGFVKELRAEYHAAYAYVLAGQGRQWSALVRLMRSWRSSRRHWRNLGMLKRLFMQRSLLPRLSP